MPALKSRRPDWQPTDEDINQVIEMLHPLRREGDESRAEAETACRNAIAAALRKIAEPPPLPNHEVKEQLNDLVKELRAPLIRWNKLIAEPGADTLRMLLGLEDELKRMDQVGRAVGQLSDSIATGGGGGKSRDNRVRVASVIADELTKYSTAEWYVRPNHEGLGIGIHLVSQPPTPRGKFLELVGLLYEKAMGEWIDPEEEVAEVATQVVLELYSWPPVGVSSRRAWQSAVARWSIAQPELGWRYSDET